MGLGITATGILELSHDANRAQQITVANEFAGLFYDSNTVEATAARVALLRIFGNTHHDLEGGVPKQLDDDQVEDWLTGQVVRAGLIGRRKQQEWDAAMLGVTSG